MLTTETPSVEKDDDLLTPPEVAKMLKVTVRALHNYRTAGKITGKKLSERCWRFERGEVKRFLNSSK